MTEYRMMVLIERERGPSVRRAIGLAISGPFHHHEDEFREEMAEQVEDAIREMSERDHALRRSA